MLGRLGMTVPQCIDAFKRLAKQVFKNEKPFLWNMKARFKSSYLVAAVKEVLLQGAWGEDEQLLISGSSEDHHCRT